VPRQIRRCWLLAAILAVALAGCGSTAPTSKPVSTPGGSGGTLPAGESGIPEPTPSGAEASQPTPTGLEHSVYYLVEDSSGTEPATGSQVTLLFEPGGRAVFYAVSATENLAHHGTWTYQSGKLALKFTAEDFKPDASLALSLGDESVTMPFQVFSTDPGTSSWRRGRLSLVSEVIAVFGAAASDQDVTVTPDAAVEEAYQTALSRVSAGGDLETNIAVGTEPNDVLIARAGGYAAPPRRPRAYAPTAPPKIKKVSKVANGVKVEFEGAPTICIPLYDWAANPASTAPLTDNPIASDPRVRLDPQKPGEATDDPAHKKAVLIAPFENGRFYGNIWTSWMPTGWGFETGTHDPSRGFDWSGYETKLTSHGYDVHMLLNEQATLVDIARQLGWGSGKAPGFVIFNTHSVAGGFTSTGMDLGKEGDTAALDAAFAAAEAAVTSAGMGDMLTYNGGTPANPTTLARMLLPRDGAPGVNDYFLALTPDFWKWLATKNGGFGSSLVYVAACEMDATSDLRDAIKAKSFLSWTQTVNPILAGAVANYLVDHLIRPTHTAEEAFYNIVRVVTTRQQIYDEDLLFKDVIPDALPPGIKFLDYFSAWGWNGSVMVNYNTSGWLDRTMDPGSVWWMVFAARWNGDAAAGAAKLVQCNKVYWRSNDPGGIADQACNAANPGAMPTQDEVGYATFVLTGKQLIPYSRTPVPRFTLDDG
jgi:hypothetical protein